jgi:hypothetical protein
MYDVLITDSAQEANPAASNQVESEGDRKSFRSRQAAEEFADRLSRSGTRLQIQKVAPQDDRDINAYLVPNPEKHIWEPKESEKQGLTFDTTPNQYGAIGEAVVAGDYGIAPGLQHYLKQHVNIPDDEYKITRRQDASIPSSVEYDGSWVPDLVVDIKRRADWATIATHFCEIKSGDASFERRQREGMESLAETHTVLQIRVDIEALPDEYTLRIDTVEPSS